MLDRFKFAIQLFALNFNFLHRLGLISVPSANQYAKIFARTLLRHKKVLLYRKNELLMKSEKRNEKRQEKKLIKSHPIFEKLH